MELNASDRIETLINKIEGQLPQSDAKAAAYLSALRDELDLLDSQKGQQDELLAKYEEAYKKLTSPANRGSIS